MFSRYVTVTVVGKREAPSSNPRILQGTSHEPCTLYSQVCMGDRTIQSQRSVLLQCKLFICAEVGNVIDPQQVSTPKILRHPSPITATLNSRAEFTCEAEGATVYDWFKNDTLLKSTGPSGRFVIEKTAMSDAGMYYCMAISSKGGKACSQKAKLTVGM